MDLLRRLRGQMRRQQLRALEDNDRTTKSHYFARATRSSGCVGRGFASVQPASSSMNRNAAALLTILGPIEANYSCSNNLSPNERRTCELLHTSQVTLS